MNWSFPRLPALGPRAHMLLTATAMTCDLSASTMRCERARLDLPPERERLWAHLVGVALLGWFLTCLLLLTCTLLLVRAGTPVALAAAPAAVAVLTPPVAHVLLRYCRLGAWATQP